MQVVLAILLVSACTAYTPIRERSWVNFKKVNEPTYKDMPDNGEPNIIRAKQIPIEERISALATIVLEICKRLSNTNAEICQRHKKPS